MESPADRTGAAPRSHAPNMYGSSSPIDVDATKAGFQNIGQYMNAAASMIQEQRNTQQFIQEQRKKFTEIAQRHQALGEQYAQMIQKTKNALNKIASVPDDGGPQVASRKPGPPDELPPAPSTGPAQNPSFGSGFNMPTFAQNQAEPVVPAGNRVPASQAVMAKVNEALPSLENNLESGRHADGVVGVGSTIATRESQRNDDNGEASQKISLGKGSKAGSSGAGNSRRGKSLREQLKEQLAKKAAYSAGESGSQSATRALLAEAEKSADGPKAGVADLPSQGASLSNASGAAGAGASGFSTSNFGQQDLKNGAFSLNGDGASQQAQRLRNELGEEKSAPEVLGRESQDLFERVRVAHQRSQKDGRVALLKR